MRFFKVLYLIILSIVSYGSLAACPTTVGTLRIEHPVIIFYNGNVPGAGYLAIHQTGSQPDKLLKVRVADQVKQTAPDVRVELHDHVPVTTDGQLIMQMVALDSIEIQAAKGDQASVVEFKKGGMHLMLYGFPEALKNAEKIALVLTFEQAGEVIVNFKVTKGAGADMKNNCSCPAHKD
jgi:copper(I)-binding protein